MRGLTTLGGGAHMHRVEMLQSANELHPYKCETAEVCQFCKAGPPTNVKLGRCVDFVKQGPLQM